MLSEKEGCPNINRLVGEGISMTIVAEDSNIRIIQLDVVGTIVSNAYLLVCQQTGDSALVDTPGDANKLLEQLKGTNPRYVLITHNHFDHLMAFDEIRSKLDVPVAAHPLDDLPSPSDILLNDGDTVSFGNIKLKVPAGSQTGQVFQLKNKGIPHLHGRGYGDQLVRLLVVTPESLTKKQRQLLEELAETLGPPKRAK